MRHEHLVVTVEAETKARIDDDLTPGESLEAWVADAIERKLAADDEAGSSDERPGSDPREGDSDGETRTLPDFGDRSDGSSGRGEGSGQWSGDGSGGDGPDGGEHDDEDDYDPGYEFVDDCSI